MRYDWVECKNTLREIVTKENWSVPVEDLNYLPEFRSERYKRVAHIANPHKRRLLRGGKQLALKIKVLNKRKRKLQKWLKLPARKRVRKKRRRRWNKNNEVRLEELWKIRKTKSIGALRHKLLENKKFQVRETRLEWLAKILLEKKRSLKERLRKVVRMVWSKIIRGYVKFFTMEVKGRLNKSNDRAVRKEWRLGSKKTQIFPSAGYQLAVKTKLGIIGIKMKWWD